MRVCANCGRENEAGARFCTDCGAPVSASAAQVVVPSAAFADASARASKRVSVPAASSGSIRPSQTVARNVPSVGSTTRISLLDDNGAVAETYSLNNGTALVGRVDGDIVLTDDVYLSPVHAQFSTNAGQLIIRDLGSRNGTWVYLDAPYRLLDGDVVLIGSQIIRFRRLGYPGPRPPENDKTRRLGSLTPPADIAVLAQVRADGSVRDTFHLSPGRTVLLGRERGDWLFPYDQTMSGAHAEVRSEDSDFVVVDAGSRNGVAIAVRGERALRAGQRVLIGDRTLRVEHL